MIYFRFGFISYFIKYLLYMFFKIYFMIEQIYKKEINNQSCSGLYKDFTEILENWLKDRNCFNIIDLYNGKAIHNSFKETRFVFESDERIWCTDELVRLRYNKNQKKYFFNKKYVKRFSISKINDIHILYEPLKRGYNYKRFSINKIKDLNSYLEIFNLPIDIDNKITNLVLKNYGWVSENKLDRNIINITQIKRKKIIGLDDMYHKMYNFIPKSWFMLQIKESQPEKLIPAILSRQTDLKSLKFIDSIFIRNGQHISNFQITVTDTFSMAWQLKAKINLKWSEKRWIIEHDRLTILLRNKYICADNIKLKISKSFKTFHKYFSKTDYFKTNKFQLLQTTYELRDEGIVQSHCVANYNNRVNEGSCVIYTSEFDGNKVTIELTKNFVINQAMMKSNKPFTKLDEFNSILNKYAIENNLILNNNIVEPLCEPELLPW